MRSVFFAKPDPVELRRSTAGWRQVWVWLPVAIAVAMIAIESTDTFSAENTSGWIRPWMERIFGHINDTIWGWGHYLARKSGHFSGYGLVSLSWLRAWLLTLGLREGWTRRMWRWRSCALAIAGTALVASLDEWHQTFIPSRTGLLSDVVLDTIGGTVMCGMVWLLCWRRNNG